MPSISRNQVNKAADLIARGKVASRGVTSDEIDDAVGIIQAWRVAHTYPLNTFNVNLRGKVRGYASPIVAQRLKRMPTILDKLNREPAMQYTNMQDIGGVRAIVNSNKEVRELVKKYKKNSGHILVDEKDYISSPRASDGYRSHHLVYKYVGRNKTAQQYNDLRIEVQLRTKLQHSWATAVETMGVIIGQKLKNRQGDDQWLDFFAVVSSAFAHIEKTPLVPGYDELTSGETYALVMEREEKLKAIEKLLNYSNALSYIYSDEGKVGRPKSGYVLLTLDMKEHSVTIRTYTKEEAERANNDYEAREQETRSDPLVDVVLVSAGSLNELKKAYPNYFLDVKEFVGQLDRIKTIAKRLSAAE